MESLSINPFAGALSHSIQINTFIFFLAHSKGIRGEIKVVLARKLSIVCHGLWDPEWGIKTVEALCSFRIVCRI